MLPLNVFGATMIFSTGEEALPRLRRRDPRGKPATTEHARRCLEMNAWGTAGINPA
jgi:hypothetical protein